jgi:hypothetical protein
MFAVLPEKKKKKESGHGSAQSTDTKRPTRRIPASSRRPNVALYFMLIVFSFKLELS